MERKKKTGQGRKKIAIEKIASEEARHVCFSKRRYGVFTKATDLATLCGAEVVIVVNSPAGNPYSFGSPGVYEVADRFLSGNLLPPGSSTLRQEYRKNAVRELNMQCMELARRKEIADAKKSMLEARLNALVQKNPMCKMAVEPEDLGLTQLKQVEEALKRLKMRTDERIAELIRGRGASSSNAIVPANHAGMMNRFTLGAGQTFNPNLSYGREF